MGRLILKPSKEFFCFYICIESPKMYMGGSLRYVKSVLELTDSRSCRRQIGSTLTRQIGLLPVVRAGSAENQFLIEYMLSNQSQRTVYLMGLRSLHKNRFPLHAIILMLTHSLSWNFFFRILRSFFEEMCSIGLKQHS